MGTCIETSAAESIDSRRNGIKSGAVEEESKPQCIHRLFEVQAERTPTAPAVIFEQRQLTYAELNARANRLAYRLRQSGVGPDTLVALRVERSLEMIIGIFGVLKAGGAYVPIDPAYPAARQQAILSDSRTPVLLTQRHLPHIPFDGTLLHLDDAAAIDQPDSDPVPSTMAGHLAYTIYTSGSTGQPKGVLVTHGNLLHSTIARFRYYPESVERFLLLSSHSFDSSVAGIFWTLSQGGALVLPHEYSHQTASELAELISRHRVSHMLCLPSLYNVLLDQFNGFGSLKCVIVAGESCPPSLVERHHALAPQASLYNEYGPTEGTVWSTVYKCWRANGYRIVPIGKPIPGTEIYILDENLKPVLNGASGEIYIGGPGVARGYFNQPELTEAKFISLPIDPRPGSRLYKTGDRARWLPDGNIEFLGRADNQIKLRGHRIELEEIESVLRECPGVQEAVVIAPEKRRPLPVNGEAEQSILRQLDAMDPIEAGRLLDDIERQVSALVPVATDATAPSAEVRQFVRQTSQFDVTLALKETGFIQPPRPSQRTWLLNRALDELQSDILELDALAQRMVPGTAPDPGLSTFTADRSQAELSEQEILEDWHIPLMQAMARAVTASHGDILEIGFGRGLASQFLQDCNVRSHTIIECNDSVIRRFFEPWRARHEDRDIRLVRGKWQDVIDRLGLFDGIFFQTYPLDEKEFAEYLSHSVVFAEHFFPFASAHLREGGAFTYLTHEIDSLSRRHQRLVFRHFRSLTTSVENLRLPADCKDLWWSDSMVVATAIR